MPDLFPTFDIPDDVEDLEQPVEYKRSYYFDFEAGDFVVAAGKVETTDGYHAWVQRCVKAVLTERYRYLAYTDDYGSEIEEMRSAASRDQAEDLAEETITDALLADPATGSVSDFAFEWNGAHVQVEFTIEPAIGTPTRVAIDLTA